MQIVKDTFVNNREELLPIFKLHFEESGLKLLKDMDIDVNLDFYEHMEKQGGLICVAAKEENKIKGYLSVFVSSHPHYMHKIFATIDCFYMYKECRSVSSLRHTVKMFNLVEKILKEEYNASIIQFNCNNTKNTHILAERLGYVATDVVYMKVLE